MLKLSHLFRRVPRMRQGPSLDTELKGPRLILRRADSSSWRAWHALREQSRDCLTPWEPQWPVNATTYTYYCGLLRRQWRDWRAGLAFAFAIYARLPEEQAEILVGGITISDVQYGSGSKGTVGYWLGAPFVGRGYMNEALNLISDFAFGVVGLNRLEASCMPRNAASRAVLARAGFVEEGFARAYIEVNGVREDHLLWGKTNLFAEKKTAAVSSDRVH